MINVVCVNWGLKFKPIYTQTLYNMVKRHLTIPYKFICYTNHIKLQKIIKEDNFEVRKLPFAEEYQGYWNKLSLFSPEAKLSGPCLYFDLDVVISDNVDCFATFGNDETFGVMRDFGQPQVYYNSSILKFNNSNATAGIWKPFIEKELINLGLSIVPGVGNFVLTKFDNSDEANNCYNYLEKHNIFVRKVSEYGLADCLRITIGLEEENIFLIQIINDFMKNN